MTEDEKSLMSTLLKRIMKGDKSAYTELYERFFNVVRCFILRFLDDTHKQIAEDLAQETFLKLLEPNFKIPFLSNPSAYFLQIAKNKVYDFNEKCKRYPVCMDILLLDLMGYNKDEALDILEKVTFEQLFKGLTPREEKLVLLRYDSGYKVYEIAKRLSVSKRTLNRAYDEIKKKLKIRLKELEVA